MAPLARLLVSAAALLPLCAAGNRPDLNEFANDWYLAGITIPTYTGVVLSPGVVGRAGYMMRLSPLSSQHFDLETSLVFRRPSGQHIGQGVVIWYLYENYTEAVSEQVKSHAHNQDELIANSWIDPFLENGLQLSLPDTYKGLGIFFTESDTERDISCKLNDGKKVKMGKDIPSGDRIKLDMNEAPVTIKLKVEPGKNSEIEIVGKGTIKLSEPLKSGGFFAITTFTGKGSPGAKTTIVEMKSFEVHNKDAKATGKDSEVHGIPEAHARSEEQLENAEDVLAGSSAHKDHRQESAAIKDLTNMVFKLVVESQPMRMQMSRAIETLGKRVEAVEKNFAELKMELDKKSGHKLGAEFEAIKQELTSLSNVASKETQERHQKLESLHSDIADVHKTAHSPDVIDKHLEKLAHSNSKVLDKLTSEHQMMFGTSIAAIAFIVIAGLSLYNKFRCWEKKHVL